MTDACACVEGEGCAGASLVGAGGSEFLDSSTPALASASLAVVVDHFAGMVGGQDFGYSLGSGVSATTENKKQEISSTSQIRTPCLRDQLDTLGNEGRVLPRTTPGVYTRGHVATLRGFLK